MGILKMSITVALGIVALLTNPRTASAVPESQLKETMSTKVAAYLEKHGHYDSFPGQKNLNLVSFTLSGPGGKGDVILIPGQGEFIPKYYELAYDLVQRGYSAVHILDHRGQGASERVLQESPEKGSVESFSDYTKDLGNFISSVRRQRPGQKIFLIAHSMGAGIAALTIRDGMFDAVAFSAPMFGIRVPVIYDSRYMMPLLKTLCMTEKKCDDFAPGKSKFNLYLDFKTNVLTHSQARWEMHKNMLKESPILGINGPTTRWVLEATKAMFRVSDIAPPKNTPMLIFQAVEDQVVLPKPQVTYCAKSENCHLVKVRGAKHEILQESDIIRAGVLDQVDRFFN